MADLTPPEDAPATTLAARVRGSWGRTRIAARIGILYGLSRVVTTGLLLLAAELAGPDSRIGEGATLADIVVAWDANWYWYTAVFGYPSVLPVTDAGQVGENSWAFMPVYAYLAQWLGLGAWGVGALIISLVSGYLACLVLYRLLAGRIGEGAALWAVLFFASAPLAALFQVGYAEPLFLLLLFLALLAVQERRYAWLYLLIPLMGYTRPGVLAFALFLGLHGIHRWVTRRREPLPVRQIAHIVAAGLLAVAVGFSWQLIAAAVTGDSGAYLATELAWRRNWIGDASAGFVPFDGFVRAAEFWFGTWGLPPIVASVSLALLVGATASALLLAPQVRRLGVDLRLWAASYIVYILLVFFPQSSIFRLLVPLSPLWGAVAAPASTRWRATVLVGCLVGQWIWIYSMYAQGNTYWQIP